MKACVIGLCILVGMMGGAAAWATPSTLIWIPSTDLQAPETWHLGIDNYFPPDAGASSPTDVGLTYGGGRWEAGVDFFGGTNSPLQFNAKVALAQEAREGVSVVAGIFGVGTAPDTTGNNIIYGLASKTFNGTRLTAGYWQGRKQVLGEDHDGLMLGVDRTLGHGWWAAADYQQGDSGFGATSLGVSYNLTPDIGLLVGWVDYHNSDLDDAITTQLDINF